MFRFVVRHLRWLARVPGFPQFFDALLVAWTVFFHRRRLAAMEAIEASVLQWPGVKLRVHRLGGVEFTIGGQELGHLHGNGLLDVKVGCGAASLLVQSGRAAPHHVLGDSAWISFWVKTMEDISTALDLLEIARQLREDRLSARL